MPFTPFHIGPGAALKAVTGRYFSLMVFGFAQILIDLEPLIRMLQRDSVLHGISHTYLGALIIGLPACLAGKVLCQWLLRVWNALWSFRYLSWLKIDTDISWLAAGTGAWIGTFSHVLLDSMMHADMHPLWPFGPDNGLLDMIPASWLYLLCTVLGVFGFMAIVVVGLWKRWAIEIP